MGDLNIMSFNVRGIRNKEKRIKIFNHIKEKMKDGITFLQETHSSGEVCKTLEKEWKGTCYFNSGSSNSRGVAILFPQNCEYQILRYENDNLGRLQLLSIVIENCKYLLVNVYNPNTEAEQVIFLQNMKDALNQFPEVDKHKLIIGGDFNFTYDLNLDALGGNPTLKLKSISEITKIKEQFDLCDIFRTRYPHTRRYTYRSKTPTLSRRLDHFNISRCNNMSTIYVF